LPEAQGETVELGAVHHVGNGFGGGAERDGQHAGGERIERAAMARLLGVERAADTVDDVGAGQAGGFVDDEPAIERAAADLAGAVRLAGLAGAIAAGRGGLDVTHGGNCR
jgi:hypothetical protein